MNRSAAWAALCLASLLWASESQAFCGFYVAKADAKLFNKASRVAMVRDEDRTVITMANDYQGPLKEFAIVVPVPTFLKREQIHIGDPAVLEHLDAYSAPRLVEYHDPDPCWVANEEMHVRGGRTSSARFLRAADASRQKSLGVKIEAQYQIGEYDILILSAKESNGLTIWLRENGYKIPRGAGPILASYIRQKTRFFVARVNLKEQAKLGQSYLRPIQIAFESPKFMLPIRLGTVNANGPQDLLLYTLTRKGRVETTNYRTVKLPTDAEVPLYVKEEFADFYRAMFSHQVAKEDMRAVFLEYAWDMGWCDPCAADPLSREELRSLGVFWLEENPNAMRAPPGGPESVFISRLHVRYDAKCFPEDLVFQETADRTNFQGRYILRHPWKGQSNCAQLASYRDELRKRRVEQARTLSSLTGWSLATITRKMRAGGDAYEPAPDTRKWYQKIWSR